MNSKSCSKLFFATLIAFTVASCGLINKSDDDAPSGSSSPSPTTTPTPSDGSEGIMSPFLGSWMSECSAKSNGKGIKYRYDLTKSEFVMTALAFEDASCSQPSFDLIYKGPVHSTELTDGLKDTLTLNYKVLTQFLKPTSSTFTQGLSKGAFCNKTNWVTNIAEELKEGTPNCAFTTGVQDIVLKSEWRKQDGVVSISTGSGFSKIQKLP